MHRYTASLQPANRGSTLLSQKMKTLQSVGTFNETPVNYSQFDQSIICRRDVFVQNPFMMEENDKQEKGEQTKERIKGSSDVGEIARMKMLYESRVNNQKQAASRVHNKSMDRSPNGRSIQKHILKPTHTPSFNKFEPKNISYSIIQHSQLSPLRFTNPNNQTPLIQQQIKRSQLNASSKKSVMDCSQISSRFDGYEFGFQNRSPESRVGSENQHAGQSVITNDMDNNTTPKKIDFSQLKVLKPMSINIPEPSPHQKCLCESSLREFMQQTTAKLTQLTSRLMYLQDQNARLRQLQTKLNELSQSLGSYHQKNQLLSQECTQLRESNYTHQAQKEELQTLLKEILFKREKEKLHRSSQSSKENTYREKDTAGDKRAMIRDIKKGDNNPYNLDNYQQTDFVDQIGGHHREYKQTMLRKDSTTNSRKSVEPLGLKSSNIQHKPQIPDQKPKKQPDSKIKVQNLLSKLQIKIQKS